MQAVVRGFIIGAEKTDKGGIRASLVQGARSQSFYVKPEFEPHFAQYVGGAPIEVELDVVIYPGQDFDTKAPTGALSVQATGVRHAVPAG